MKANSIFIMSIIIFQISDINAQQHFSTTKKNHFGVKIIISGSVDLFGGSTYRINNFPEYMRDIPIHPDDDDVPSQNHAPIPDGITNFSNIFSIPLSIGLAPQVSFYNINIKFETGVYYDIFYPFTWLFTSIYVGPNIRERDYRLDPGSSSRGYGTALTYYRIYYKLENGIPYYYRFNMEIKLNEYKLEYNEKAMLNLILGFEVFNSYDLYLENGWDRYNSLEDKDTFLLGTFQHRRFYGGIIFKKSNIPLHFFCFLGYTNIKQEIIIKGIKYNRMPLFIKLGTYISIGPDF